MSDYLASQTDPADNSNLDSSVIRAVITAIGAGFDKLPALTGNGSKIVAVNSGGTALEALTTTGTGSGVRATSPTLVTPNIGAATGSTLVMSGAISTDSTTDSSSITTGSIQTDGGAGIAKQLVVGKLVDLSTATAGQIKFPASQNASADANTLDDYEEGTWTPSLGGTTTYFQQVGQYVKIGKQVSFTGYLEINAIGTGSTTNISGLPFAADGYGPVVSVIPLDVVTSNVLVVGRISSTTIALIAKAAAATGFSSLAMFGDNKIVYVSGTYFTA